MTSASGTALLRCMQPSAAEPQWNPALIRVLDPVIFPTSDGAVAGDGDDPATVAGIAATAAGIAATVAATIAATVAGGDGAGDGPATVATAATVAAGDGACPVVTAADMLVLSNQQQSGRAVISAAVEQMNVTTTRAGIDTAAQVLPRPYLSLGVTVLGDLNPGDLLLCPGRRGTAFLSSLSVATPGPRDPRGSGSIGKDRRVLDPVIFPTSDGDGPVTVATAAGIAATVAATVAATLAATVAAGGAAFAAAVAVAVFAAAVALLLLLLAAVALAVVAAAAVAAAPVAVAAAISAS
ncbi:uncharacterized protein LOC135821886 [Sycon ciliatum]|uniref:uncharacterized protein LOC135821886 n=1 Tax=Sycon ciliatum TaxID=27933 RepID=UPI0031F66B65